MARKSRPAQQYKTVPDATVASQVSAERPGSVASMYPTVALVGRPNVGKSSLFNALLKREISITDARAGTTRDRVLHPLTINEKACDLMDTGGIGIIDKQQLSADIEQQIEKAIHAATILVFVVDGKEGLTPLDREVARRIRKLGRPIILAVNKTEGKDIETKVAEFAELGIEPVVATAAAHRRGLDDLEEAIEKYLPDVSPEADSTWADVPRIAVVGRRNVGKSSFCNMLARENRTIVSDIAGTTRDSIDVLLQKDNQKFCLVDTAGLRRMKQPEGPVEFFSQVRTERAIRRSDVVMLMLSAEDGVSTTDRKTADLIIEEHKPCVIVVNKWDQNKDVETGTYLEYLEQRLPTLREAPVAFTSALKGQRCWQTLDVALELYQQSSTQVPTPMLNKVIEKCEQEHEPPTHKTKKPRLLYGVQVSIRPPTFVIYCRHAEKIDAKYQRYLSSRMREMLDLAEIPVRLLLREAPR